MPCIRRPRFVRSPSGDRYRWCDRIIPRRLEPRFIIIFLEPRSIIIIFWRRMPDTASMLTHTAQIAMAIFMKRMYGFPPPWSYRLPFVQSCLAARVPAGTTVLQINQQVPGPAGPETVPETGHWQPISTALD